MEQRPDRETLTRLVQFCKARCAGDGDIRVFQVGDEHAFEGVTHFQPGLHPRVEVTFSTAGAYPLTQSYRLCLDHEADGGECPEGCAAERAVSLGPAFELLSWEEFFVHVLAHELRHCEQWNDGRKFDLLEWERDAEEAALAVVLQFRREQRERRAAA